jgi:UDP-glucose 4-epimerase
MALVMVTGGAGFIGSHLVDALVQKGDTVRVIDNFSSGQAANLSSSRGRIEVVEGDVRSIELLHGTMRDVEIVYHAAAISSVGASMAEPLACNDINVGGTLNVLTAARDAAVRRVVFFSSAAVYGADPRLPKTEDMNVSPLSPYAASKAAGELYCHVFSALYDLETVCLRPFNVYGPRQNPTSEYSGVVSRFIERLLAGEPLVIEGDGEQSRDFVFVGDIVAACLLAAGTQGVGGGVFNVGSGAPTSINKLAEVLVEVVHLGAVASRTVHREARSGDIRHSLASVDQAHSRVGYSPRVRLADGLTRTATWLRQERAT